MDVVADTEEFRVGVRHRAGAERLALVESAAEPVARRIQVTTGKGEDAFTVWGTPEWRGGRCWGVVTGLVAQRSGSGLHSGVMGR